MIRLSKKLLSAGVTLAAAALLMSGCKSTIEAPLTYQGTIIAQVSKHNQNFDIMPSAVARAAAKMVINNMEMSVASPSRIYLTIFFDNEKTEWVKLQVDYSLDKGEYSVKAVDSSAKRENGVGRRGDNSMAKRLMVKIGWAIQNPNWQPKKLSDEESDVIASLYEEAEAKQFKPLPDKAVVYLWRNDAVMLVRSYFSEARLKPAYLDGKCFGLLRPRSFYRLEVEPGVHHMVSGSSNIKLNLEAGKIYYLHLNMYHWTSGWGFAWITRMTEQRGQNAVKSAYYFKNGFCARPNLIKPLPETPLKPDVEVKEGSNGPDSSNSAVPAEDSGAQGAGTGTGAGASGNANAGDSGSSDKSTDAGTGSDKIRSTDERAPTNTGKGAGKSTGAAAATGKTAGKAAGAGAGRNTNPAAAAGKATGKPSGASAITGKTNGTGAVSSQKTDAAAGKTAGKSEGAADVDAQHDNIQRGVTQDRVTDDCDSGSSTSAAAPMQPGNVALPDPHSSAADDSFSESSIPAVAPMQPGNMLLPR